MNNPPNEAQIHRLKEQLEDRFNALWAEIGSQLKGSAKERFLQIAGEGAKATLKVTIEGKEYTGDIEHKH